MANTKNDLDVYIAERTRKNPRFPDLVRAAEERQGLARQLADVRRKGELSQTAMAAAMQTSASIISRLENGADVRLSTLQKYADVLNYELRLDLVPRTEDKRKKPKRRRKVAATAVV